MSRTAPAGKAPFLFTQGGRLLFKRCTFLYNLRQIRYNIITHLTSPGALAPDEHSSGGQQFFPN